MSTEFLPPLYFEITAIFLWAVSGAVVGRRKDYDVVGVFVVAVVAALGGGILRDGLLLQRVPPLLTNPVFIPVVIVAVTLVMLIGRRVQRDRRLPKAVAVIDALAVPMYAVLGAELALDARLPTLSVLFVATVSGVGGGLLRDILVGDTPELLRPGQYNTLLVVAAVALYLVMVSYTPLTQWTATWITIALFFTARILTIRYNWRTRPVSEFELSRVLQGMTGLVPGRKKEE